MKNQKVSTKSVVIKKAIAEVAKKATTANANSTCMFVVHQPKMPKGAEKLRRF